LFAFGHGLSYAKFVYSRPVLSGGKEMTVRFTVKNVGKVAGIDVPQIYAGPADGRWPARLVGYARVDLQPGASTEVTVTAEPRILADWSESARRFEIASGRYRVEIGRSAGDRENAGEIQLQARAIR
jgi:beta-glucosidase